ncbi:uncharacterized protein JN550_009919 [Neoarthrinium moseri]|uniref:uncharacterized protein n=1 Tax=Neoarthrinium moseri TaxID=1658444 RepID=UPI001FDB57C9|nr:uncharacterized protein JN550_009919 [Neoarthrinium moseri]KAI1862772.1 hypothetical protein JN550_009919 [Neoarthrinium moseri]
MPPSNDLSDDFVADLLSKEAAECALKYSAVGMDAYTGSAKRPAHHPKPNTRFLNNIVKATDSHNRNLLAQERADSQARLNDLERAKQQERRASEERDRRRRPAPGDVRKRMLGDITAIIGGSSKKRKTDDRDAPRDVDSESRRSKKPRDDSDIKIRGRAHEAGDRDGSSVKDRNSRKELFADHGPRRGLDREDRHRSKRASSREDRHRGDRGDRGDRSDNRRRDKHGPSSSRHRHESSRVDREPQRTRDRRQETRGEEPTPRDVSESDSDPLDDIIGPKPPSPIRRRGRGAVSGSSGMDSRFASGYDPKVDVSLGHDDDDDWGTALEALKDRQRWKEQGADRLRAAGFTEDQVKKWEKGDKKDEDDVRWTKKGEQREWDRGKTLLQESDGSLV